MWFEDETKGLEGLLWKRLFVLGEKVSSAPGVAAIARPEGFA